MFLHQSGPASWISPRNAGHRTDDDLDITGLTHTKHSEAETSTKISETSIALASISLARGSSCEPHLIAHCRSIDRLQDKFEVEAKLHLSNDNKRRVNALKRDDVTAANFALYDEPEALEKSFDGKVKRGFQIKRSRSEMGEPE